MYMTKCGITVGTVGQVYLSVTLAHKTWCKAT